MLGRAREAGILNIQVHNIRDWAEDKHQVTDDRPFGGGAGMVMKPQPVFKAVEALRKPGSRVIFLTPDGVPLTPVQGSRLARCEHMILLSGHYEGIDQRIRDHLVDEEVSIGDYVLTNGTLAGPPAYGRGGPECFPRGQRDHSDRRVRDRKTVDS